MSAPITLPKIIQLVEMVSQYAIAAEIQKVTLTDVQHQGKRGWKIEFDIGTDKTGNKDRVKTLFLIEGEPVANLALQLTKLALELHHIG